MKLTTRREQHRKRKKKVDEKRKKKTVLSFLRSNISKTLGVDSILILRISIKRCYPLNSLFVNKRRVCGVVVFVSELAELTD